MSQDRLNSLAIMSMESDITKQLDYSDVIYMNLLMQSLGNAIFRNRL